MRTNVTECRESMLEQNLSSNTPKSSNAAALIAFPYKCSGKGLPSLIYVWKHQNWYIIYIYIYIWVLCESMDLCIYPFYLTWNLRGKKDFDFNLYPCPHQRYTVILNKPRFNTSCHFTAVKLPEGRRDHHGRAKTFPTCRTSTPCPAHGVHVPRPRHYHLQKHFDLTTINYSCKELQFAAWFHILLKTLHRLRLSAPQQWKVWGQQRQSDDASFDRFTASRPRSTINEMPVVLCVCVRMGRKLPITWKRPCLKLLRCFPPRASMGKAPWPPSTRADSVQSNSSEWPVTCPGATPHKPPPHISMASTAKPHHATLTKPHQTATPVTCMTSQYLVASRFVFGL